LYFSILNAANQAGWKEELSIPNSYFYRFNKDMLNKSRKNLVKYRLITYKKGKKGHAPKYSIIPLYNDINPEKKNYNENYTHTNERTICRTYININIKENINNCSQKSFEVYRDDYDHENLEALTRKRY